MSAWLSKIPKRSEVWDQYSAMLKAEQELEDSLPDDLELKIKHQICEGEWVATSYIMTGTHSGEWMGIKPTYKKVQISGVNLDRVINGKIVVHSGAANLLEPLLEIQALKIIGKEIKES